MTGLGPVVEVSPSGGLGLVGEAPRLDWWIGADDRWHRASTEVAVRQVIAGVEASVETRLRVPGGDVISRTVAVPHGGTTLAVVEIENATPVPVALAVVLSVSGSISISEDAVLVDGTEVMRAGRAIARVCIGSDLTDLATSVENGEALPPAELDLPAAAGCVAAVFPLPHTAKLQYVTGINSVERLPRPQDLPPLDAVDRGWTGHLATGARVDVADEALGRVANAARRHLLVGSMLSTEAPFWTVGVEPWVPALAAVALDMWGHHGEAEELLLSALGRDDLAIHAVRSTEEAGALLWALASRLERAGDPDLEAALVPWIEEAVLGLTARSRRDRSNDGEVIAWRAVGLASAASLLSRASTGHFGQDFVDALPELIGELDQTDTTLAMTLAGRRLDTPSRSDPAGWLAMRCGFDDMSLRALVAGASPTGAIALAGRLQHPLASALVLIAVRTAVVDEPAGAGGPISVLPRPEEVWIGAPIEGHDLPVTGGTVSFAVRWHGDRPALLWDLQLVESGPSPTVSCPGLDVAWSDDRPKGEALLSADDRALRTELPRSSEVVEGERLDPGDDHGSFR